MSRDIWDPYAYGAFSDERGRPFFELLARIETAAPDRVVDLGCGPGELTVSLARRWPKARVEGIDSSPLMIERAGELAAGDGLRFTLGDIESWRPTSPVDVIISNAALHWVPDHQRMLPSWIDDLTPGGTFAFSVPGNFDAPSHVILRELCRSDRWKERLAGTVRHDVISAPGEYLSLLAGHGCVVDAWETTYCQVLHGPDPVLNWVRGTGLRPVLAALDDPAEFLGEYGARLAEAYPPQSYGTVYPFRRLFVVARKT